MLKVISEPRNGSGRGLAEHHTGTTWEPSSSRPANIGEQRTGHQHVVEVGHDVVSVLNLDVEHGAGQAE